MSRPLRRHHLEQGHVDIFEGCASRADLETFVQVSIALSLKRIADALQGDPKNSGIRDILSNLSEMHS